MKKIIIDGVELSDKMVAELNRWYNTTVESAPEQMLLMIQDTKDLLIRLMCNGNNESYLSDFKDCLSGLLIIEDGMKEMVPEKNNL